MSSSAQSSIFSGIQISLKDASKWAEFHPRTEMIVTRARGRVVFPHLDYSVRGLEPRGLYSLFVHLERVDDVKYKFDEGQWQFAAKGDPVLSVQYFEHPDGARSGEHWMREPVSFATLKITNDIRSQNPRQIIVQSMHKYQPVLTIRELGGRCEEFRLGLTEFMVVTAYQCSNVIELKKKHNKFASGHRKRARSEESPEQKKRLSDGSSDSAHSPLSSLVAPNPVNFGGFHHYYPMYYGGWNGYGGTQMDCVWPNGYPVFDENGMPNL